jgi:hypothetical protein
MSTGLAPGGYALVLPPGWIRVPVNGDPDKQLDEAIDRALPADLPRDEAARLKVKIKGRLLKAAADARDVGALDIYLPLEGMHGTAIPASFVVCEVPVRPGQAEDEALRELAGTGGEPVTVDGEQALRFDDVLAPDTLMTDVDVPSRRITYVVPVPGSPRWLTVSFSTVGDGEPAGEFAELLVALFDAIMTTFRFTD